MGYGKNAGSHVSVIKSTPYGLHSWYQSQGVLSFCILCNFLHNYWLVLISKSPALRPPPKWQIQPSNPPRLRQKIPIPWLSTWQSNVRRPSWKPDFLLVELASRIQLRRPKERIIISQQGGAYGSGCEILKNEVYLRSLWIPKMDNSSLARSRWLVITGAYFTVVALQDRKLFLFR